MESAYHLPCQDRIRKVPGHRIQVSRRFALQVTALTQPYDPTRTSYPRGGAEKASYCARLSQKPTRTRQDLRLPFPTMEHAPAWLINSFIYLSAAVIAVK